MLRRGAFTPVAIYYIACRRSYPGRLVMHIADDFSDKECAVGSD